MPRSEAKKSERALPFKFAVGGIEASAIFIGRAAELTASQAYTWVNSSDKRTGQARMRTLESEMSTPNVWRNLCLGQALGVTKITSTIMRREVERVMTVRKQEIIEQQWDEETALFNYCPDTVRRNLDHLGKDDKRQLLVKLRKDVDTVILKTDRLLGVNLQEAEESSNRERMMVLGSLGERRAGVYRPDAALDEEAIEGYDIDREIDGEEEEEAEQMSSGKRRQDFDCWDHEDEAEYHESRRSYSKAIDDCEDSDEDSNCRDIELVDILPTQGCGAGGVTGGRFVAPGRGLVRGRDETARRGQGRNASAQNVALAASSFEDRLFSLAERTLKCVEQQCAEDKRRR